MVRKQVKVNRKSKEAKIEDEPEYKVKEETKEVQSNDKDFVKLEEAGTSITDYVSSIKKPAVNEKKASELETKVEAKIEDNVDENAHKTRSTRSHSAKQNRKDQMQVKKEDAKEPVKTLKPSINRKRKEDPVKIEYEMKEEEDYDPKMDAKKKRSMTKEKAKVEISNLKQKQELGEIMNSKINKMREKRDALVDGGSEERGPDPTVSEQDQRYQFLVLVMLSTQTTGTLVNRVTIELRRFGFTMENILKTPHKELADLISIVGMQNRKAEYMQRIAQMVEDRFHGKVPSTMPELMQFPGIGKKIALLFMEHVEKNVQGVSVDTHIHRVANRLGLVKTTNPLQTSEQLEQIVDKKHWLGFNRVWVGFGQQICQPITPKCHECLLNDLCPEGRKRLSGNFKQNSKKAKVTPVKEEEEEEEEEEEVNIKKEEEPPIKNQEENKDNKRTRTRSQTKIY